MWAIRRTRQRSAPSKMALMRVVSCSIDSPCVMFPACRAALVCLSTSSRSRLVVSFMLWLNASAAFSIIFSVLGLMTVHSLGSSPTLGANFLAELSHVAVRIGVMRSETAKAPSSKSSHPGN